MSISRRVRGVILQDLDTGNRPARASARKPPFFVLRQSSCTNIIAGLYSSSSGHSIRIAACPDCPPPHKLGEEVVSRWTVLVLDCTLEHAEVYARHFNNPRCPMVPLLQRRANRFAKRAITSETLRILQNYVWVLFVWCSRFKLLTPEPIGFHKLPYRTVLST